jgi:hypothetical protein
MPVIAVVEPQPERRLSSRRPITEGKMKRHMRAGGKSNIENPTPLPAFGPAARSLHDAKR